MNAFAIACASMILMCGAVQAQSGGVVGIYPDANGVGDCNLVESVGTINSVWVVHTAGPDVEYARFRVTHNWGATFVGAQYPVIYLVDPDPFAGDRFGLPGCSSPPSLFARLDFLVLTPTPPCTVTFSIGRDPAAASGQIEVTDCDGDVLSAVAGPDVIVNGDGTCPCEEPPVGTEESTWSRVKALYR